MSLHHLLFHVNIISHVYLFNRNIKNYADGLGTLNKLI